MPSPSALHALVHAKFREAFGDPKHTLGKDEHWALRYAPDATPIDVLVNGSIDLPAVWIFDTHNGDDGVVKTRINTESEAAEIINQIRDRLEKASLKSRSGGPPPTRHA